MKKNSIVASGESVKSVLIAVLEAANSICSAATTGENPGEYSQDSLDSLTAAIGAATFVCEDESAEQAAIDTAAQTLQEAVTTFQAAVIPEPPVSHGKTVTLKGTPPQMKGNHTLHFKNSIISFKDGQATVSEAVAEELQQAGHIE